MSAAIWHILYAYMHECISTYNQMYTCMYVCIYKHIDTNHLNMAAHLSPTNAINFTAMTGTLQWIWSIWFDGFYLMVSVCVCVTVSVVHC